MNLVGSAQRLALMQQAVMAAAKRRREPGIAIATASKAELLSPLRRSHQYPPRFSRGHSKRLSDRRRKVKRPSLLFTYADGAVQAAFKSGELGKRLTDIGGELRPGDAASFAAFWKSELDRYARLVKLTGAHAGLRWRAARMNAAQSEA